MARAPRLTKFQRFLSRVHACNGARRWLDKRKLTTVSQAWDAADRAARRKARRYSIERDWQDFLVVQICYHLRSCQPAVSQSRFIALYLHDQWHERLQPGSKKLRAAVMQGFRLIAME